MLSKLSYLNSNIALTLGYLNPALNNSALVATEEVQWKIRLSDYELLFIKEKKPSLNTQSVSILAKLVVTYFPLHVQTCYFCSPVYFVTLNRIYIRSVFSFYLCHLIMMSLWHRNVVLNFFRLTVFVSV